MVSFPDSAASLIPTLSPPPVFERRVTWNEATQCMPMFQDCYVQVSVRYFVLAAGSDYKDNSLNLMPFFSTSCYTGYGDDHKVNIMTL